MINNGNFSYGYNNRKGENFNEKLNCYECNNNWKFLSPTILYILDKLLAFSVICSKCSNNNNRILR